MYRVLLLILAIGEEVNVRLKSSDRITVAYRLELNQSYISVCWPSTVLNFSI